MIKHSFVCVFLSITTIFGDDKLGNNVCKTLDDYKTMLKNKRCWRNPDIGSNTPEIVVRHGYPVEEYKAATEDNYILSVYRIPHNGYDVSRKRQPVFLQHGAGASSDQWVLARERSLAFRLADLGYDVWLGNTRDSINSRKNMKAEINNKQYWNFSLDEKGTYDMSAQLNLVADKTGMAGKIIYIGYSMGTTLSYIYSIARKEEANNLLVGIISLAPAAYMSNLPVAKSVIPHAKSIEDMLANFGVHGLEQNSRIQRQLMKIICTSQIEMCYKFLQMIFGEDEASQLMPEDIPVQFTFMSAGISVKTLSHYAQFSTSGRFQRFDYGKEENIVRYGTEKPPAYNISEITLPVHIFYGDKDVISTPKNVRLLYEQMKMKGKSINHVTNDFEVRFNHMDFLLAKDIEVLFYKALFELIDDKLKRSV